MASNNDKIAVIGMAGRFPGAANISEYWENLINGRETITHFTEEELAPFEFRFEELKNNPSYVKARGILNEVDQFDAGFFGLTPREASLTDPQHRIWLETVWDAFENAGCNPFDFPGSIGVYAGGYINTYLLNNILRDPARLENYIRLRSTDSFQVMTGNDVAFIPTKTAYKFNLKGPAVNVQTACSTSLVAIAQACQSLFSYEADACIAGGVCILTPQETGYIYQEGAIPSPDGHCRPFDADGQGTVFSNGVGAVVLKRYEDAIKDKDTIYALISGWALNNDGSNKVSYMAPSVEGQAEVISLAQSFAGISPEEIGYIEAHGTATRLGDPIELAALTKAFRKKTDKITFCGIGSVKSNIGHTDAAAGVASFIKACLSAYHRTIPPTLNFRKPNEHIDFRNSPFYVQSELKKWEENRPLIIGVSSFGIGGTNAHVIVEEPGTNREIDQTVQQTSLPELIVLSAKSETALSGRKKELLEFLTQNPQTSLPDLAFTLREGRQHMAFRSCMAVNGLNELLHQQHTFIDGKRDERLSGISFLFPGQGAQFSGMGKQLYEKFSLFREIMDQCFGIYSSVTGKDLKKILFSADSPGSEKELASTEITQPALFMVEYALARLMQSFGIHPQYLIGHSIGEYTAACLSGVFDLESALKIVIKRGHLMNRMPGGRMFAVRASSAQLLELKSDLFEIAADNAEFMCTISFSFENEEKVVNLLEKKELKFIALNTSHAFHSKTFEPILQDFTYYVECFKLSAPGIPFISCLTGKFITPEEATSGDYWARQLRNTVQFRKGLISLLSKGETALFEIGPDTHLSSLARQSKSVKNKKSIIASLGKPGEKKEPARILEGMGELWLTGAIKPPVLNNEMDRELHKIALPSYPFERKRYWIDFKLSDRLNYNDQSREADGSHDKIMHTSNKQMSKKLDRTERLKEIWKALIGLEELSSDDDFYELGGHSLLALQILTRIKEEFGINLPLKSFLDNPTINKLNKVIQHELGIPVTREEIVPHTDMEFLPLSASQKRLWIISKLEKYNPAYNIPFSYYLNGRPDLTILQKSLEYIFNRHHTMFSIFPYVDGNAHCEIRPMPVEVKLADYSPYPFSERRNKIFEFIGKDSRQTFDLEKGPLYRLYLIRESNSSYFFHATISHLIFDGWSWGILVNELNEVYTAFAHDREPDLEEIKYHLYDFAEWESKNINPLLEAEHIQYWKNKLKDCPMEINFPWDKPRDKETSGFGEKEYLRIPAETVSGLRKINKAENTTMFVSILSCLSVILSKYSGDNDFCIGTPVANRPQSRIEKIFGMLVNTIALRCRIDEKLPFLELVRQMKTEALETISHQEFAFEKVVEAIKPDRKPGVNPIFQIAFAWLNNFSLPMKLDDVSGERVTVDEGVAPFDITFYLWENEDFIEGEIEYNSDILERSTIKRLKEDLMAIMGSLAKNPELRLNLLNVDVNDRQSITAPVLQPAAEILLVDSPPKSTESPEKVFVKTEEEGSETTAQLLKIWQTVLNSDWVGPEEDFFDAGGTSLSAISLINKIEETFQREISFRDLVKNPDPQSMANLISGKSNNAEISSLLTGLKHFEMKTRLPLSLNQKRLWLISRLAPEVPTYIIPFTYSIKGRIDKKIFTDSLEYLFNRHPILYSKILEVDETPYCDIVPEKIQLQEMDFSGLSDKEKKKAITTFVNKDSVQQFDLENGPLYRLYLIKTGGEHHYFHFAVHHMIFDGWSWQIFISELGNIYNSLIDQKSPVLPEIQFEQHDYAIWENENKHRGDNPESLKFWENKLRDAPTVLNFPYDFPRKKIPSGLGGREIIGLSPETSLKLKNFSKENKVSLYATLLSSFAFLIKKYSGENDIVIGTPVSDRPVSSLENIFGMFVNTLAIRLKFDQNLPFNKFAAMTHEEILESMTHQDVPFDKVVDLINPDRSLNINPLFQVSFAWQNNLNVPLKMRGLQTDRFVGDEGTSAFDLSFYMWENGDVIEGEIEYNADILTRETIQGLRERYLLLVENIVRNFKAPVHSIPIISEEDKRKVLEFTNMKSDYPSDKTITQLFEEWVQKSPDKTALVFKDRSLTYREMDSLSNRLARTLRKAGVKPDMPVGLIFDKNIEIIISLLAILKSGGAYLPIDPEYPVHRKEFILRDANCKIILCQEDYLESIPVEEIKKINVNDPFSFHPDSSALDNINKPTDLAYILYTSGTTGNPKGSMIQQNSVVRLVKNTNFITYRQEDRFMLTGAIVFDVSTFEIWGPLLNGATLYIVEKETILKPQAFGEELHKNKITTIWVTSALLTQLVEIRTDIFSGLTHLLAGGDVLSPQHVNKLRRDNPGLTVINGYGPTENTTFSSCFTIEKEYKTSIPIGKPISNSTVYIFDEHLNYQPVGIVGELYFGGDGVSRGYLNRDELNREKFIMHPEIPGERLYKSGDMGRWLPDGNIEFHGRVDNQLKIRGFRVELEEIEAVLRSLEGVVESVVKAYKINEGDVRLIAFLNTEPDFSMDLKQITSTIKEKLPVYMLPSAFKIMHGFPRNINGKIDKKALSFNPEELQPKKRETTSLTSVEQKLFDIWSEILKSNNFGINDNYFTIGGNSLSAISIIARIEAAFNIKLNLRIFFDSPRIKDLAENIELAKIKSMEKETKSGKDSKEVKLIEGEI